MMGRPISQLSFITTTGFPSNLYRRLAIVVSILLTARLFFGGVGTGADPTGFVSLDCGGVSGTYTWEGLTWTPDDGFGLEGVSKSGSVDGPYLNPPPRYSTIRYFTGNQRKYCYVFDGPGIGQSQVYLVRASFWLGAGDIPFTTLHPYQSNFQLLINSDVWDNISISLPQTDPVVKEIYVQELDVSVNNTPALSVCFAGRGIGLDTPFISSLELRPLSPQLHSALRVTTDSQALFLQSRVTYAPSDVRYPDDKFDRIWTANTTAGPRVNATRTFNLSDEERFNYPPHEVLQTALLSPNNASLNITVNVSTPYFMILYFYDVTGLLVGPVFNVTIHSSDILLLPDTVDFAAHHICENIFDIHDVEGRGPVQVIELNKLPNATYGPFITAFEVFRIANHERSLGANTIDADAIYIIEKGADGLDGWSGDPCLPYAYDWLSCSNETRPRIVSLVLSNQNITGSIPSSIRVLTSLVELDLQGNKLNGSIPEFLAQLPNLRILNLQDNNLSGTIPKALINKANMNMSLAGNPFLCDDKNNQSYCLTNPNHSISKHKNQAPLVGGIIGALVGALIFFGLCAYCYYKKGRHANAKHIESNVLSQTQVVECTNQARQFNYKEIQAISSKFKTRIGRGSFGPVYYGLLSHEVRVAMKVLQQDSTQGTHQFLNEVRLLSRIHHKNLVRFIGYCIEEKLVLVYEYMPNGSLHDFLFGKSQRRLSWLERLNIIVGSAEGLGYLHKGCSPSIVHRDVKPSNILLNEEMVAKISDFGISRASLFDQLHRNLQAEMVTQVQGSYGYLDPEHFQTQQINEKVDVYAFGVVLLQVVSGRPPLIQQSQLHLTEWARSFVERGAIDEIVDPSIANDNYNLSSMWKVVEIAMMCVENESRMRPDMSEVSSEVKLALAMELENQDSSSFYSQSLPSSVQVR